ncbi:MAG: 2-C-methyl-D-erythritol 4-phosphate cytidylyltransferase [Verrucomicrobiae bacterium]|nr:2-C-methyl-D-erythritol 4-phosphate cytidylyltransferase [Verrucomicrobiae bacterium]
MSRTDAKAAAILLAAGRSRRMGGGDKLFLKLRGRPVLFYSLRVLQRCPEIGQIVLTCNPENRSRIERLARAHRFHKVGPLLPGGAERSDSVAEALEGVRPEFHWVVIHDGARPLLTVEMVRKGLETARRHGTAVIAKPMSDTVKRATSEGKVLETPDRRELYAVQTPQIFRRSDIRSAYAKVRSRRLAVTDDAAAMEADGKPVYLYEWAGYNLKVTRPEDLPVISALLNGRSK